MKTLICLKKWDQCRSFRGIHDECIEHHDSTMHVLGMNRKSLNKPSLPEIYTPKSQSLLLTSVTLILKDTVSPRSHLSRSQRQPSVGSWVRSMYWSTPFSSRAKPPRGPGTRVGPPTTVKLNVRVCSKVPTSFTNVSLWITMSVPGNNKKMCVHTDICSEMTSVLAYYQSTSKKKKEKKVWHFMCSFKKREWKSCKHFETVLQVFWDKESKGKLLLVTTVHRVVCWPTRHTWLALCGLTSPSS